MEAETYGGAILVRDNGHRWWFDVTNDEEGVVLCAEVEDMDKRSMTGAGTRHYAEEPHAPPSVVQTLRAEMTEDRKILDWNGNPL